MPVIKRPNRDALDKALNFYRDAMRPFIVQALKRSPDWDVQNFIAGTWNPDRATRFRQLLRKEGGDLEAVIDVGDFPQIIGRNWRDVFSHELPGDPNIQSKARVIAEARNKVAHPGKGDLAAEETRVYFFHIAEVLGLIKEPDAKHAVETIKNQWLDAFAAAPVEKPAKLVIPQAPSPTSEPTITSIAQPSDPSPATRPATQPTSPVPTSPAPRATPSQRATSPSEERSTTTSSPARPTATTPPHTTARPRSTSVPAAPSPIAPTRRPAFPRKPTAPSPATAVTNPPRPAAVSPSHPESAKSSQPTTTPRTRPIPTSSPSPATPAPTTSTSQADISDRAALVALYRATNGPRWINKLNWRRATPLSQWHGVTTDGLGRVTALDLSTNRLQGIIPTELSHLTNLEVLNLRGNQLSGEIPAELSRLTNLKRIFLSGNQLTGYIPPELRSVWLSDLGELGLPFRPASYSTPNVAPTPRAAPRPITLPSDRRKPRTPSSTVSTSTPTVRQRSVTRRESIPVQTSWPHATTNRSGTTDKAALIKLYQTTNGDHWVNNDNWLTDEPLSKWHGVTVDQRGSVSRLHLVRNQLSGRIPVELSLLINLQWLNLSGNQLSGEIPADLGRLTKLRVLGLAANQLSGTISPDLGSLTNLNWLSLSKNQLSGEIPAELTQLKKLTKLYVAQNHLIGFIPRVLFDVSVNDLPELGLPVETRERQPKISAQSASPPGHVSSRSAVSPPSRQGTTTQATSSPDVTVSDAHVPTQRRLRGRPRTPPDYSSTNTTATPKRDPVAIRQKIDAASITPLSTASSRTAFSEKDVLILLYQATNGDQWANNRNWQSSAPLGQWHGVITDSNGKVTNLKLGGNLLRGSIPSELGLLTDLRWLYLPDNQLQGGIPTELGNLTKLRRLDLSGNQLRGETPDELGNISGLQELYLARNNLTGYIPRRLRRIPRSDISNLGLPLPDRLSAAKHLVAQAVRRLGS